MLGASDFRKNLSRFIEMSSPMQYAVADLLEFRFPARAGGGTVEAVLAALDAAARGHRPSRAVERRLPPTLASQLRRLASEEDLLALLDQKAL